MAAGQSHGKAAACIGYYNVFIGYIGRCRPGDSVQGVDSGTKNDTKHGKSRPKMSIPSRRPCIRVPCASSLVFGLGRNLGSSRCRGVNQIIFIGNSAALWGCDRW